MSLKPSQKLVQVHEDIEGAPIKNPNGGYTVGYICEADPMHIISKAAQLTSWSDTAFIAYDHPDTIADKSNLLSVCNLMRKGDILLVATQADISACSESIDLIEQDGVIVTVLEGLVL